MLQLSSESSLSSTHTPRRRFLSIAILPQSLFFMPVFFWQRCITAEVALNLGEVTLSCSSLLRVVELVWQAGVAVTLLPCIHCQPQIHADGTSQSSSSPNPQAIPRAETLSVSSVPSPPSPTRILLKTEWDCCTHTAQQYIPKLLVPDSVLHSALSAPLAPPHAHTQLSGLASLHATAHPFNSFPRCNLAACPSSQLSVLYS